MDRSISCYTCQTTVNDVLLSATVGAIRAYSGKSVNSSTVMRMLLPFGFEAKLDDMPANDRLTNGFAFCSSDLSKVESIFSSGVMQCTAGLVSPSDLMIPSHAY